jgi:putative endonuclease
MYCVYVLESLDEPRKYYLGCTGDLEKRIAQHNRGENTSTKNQQWRCVYYEAYTTKAYALKREYTLKKNRRMHPTTKFLWSGATCEREFVDLVVG